MKQNSHNQNDVHYDNQQEVQSEDLEEMQGENSFEGENKIFQLKSEIHSLQIEKNKLALEHQASQVSYDGRIQQLNIDISFLKNENHKLKMSFRELEKENEILLRQKQNEKLAIKEEQKRLEIGINNEKIKMEKDKQIQIKHKQDQIAKLNNAMQEFKIKQISSNREYEVILQVKQEIIKKLSADNQRHTILIQKLNADFETVQRQIQQKVNEISNYKNQIDNLSYKYNESLKQIGKLKKDWKKKEQALISEYQNERNELAKSFGDKLKRSLKEKDDKVMKAQEKVIQVESRLMILTQELHKEKSQSTLLAKFNSYLELTIKQSNQNRQQSTLSYIQKDKELSQTKQQHLTEIGDLRKSMAQQRIELKNKNVQIEEQLSQLRYAYEKQKQVHTHFKHKQQNFNKTIQNLQIENQKLFDQISILTTKLKQTNNHPQSTITQNNQQKLNQSHHIKRAAYHFILAKEELENCMQQSQIRRKIIEQKENQILSLNHDNKRLSKDNLRIKTQLQFAEKKNRQKVQECKDLHSLLEEVKQSQTKINKGLRLRIEQIEGLLGDEKKRWERKKKQVEELEHQIIVLTKEHKSKKELLESKLDQLDNKLKQQKILNKNLHEQLFIIGKENHNLKDGQTRNRTEQSATRQQKDKLCQQIEALEQKIRSLENKIFTHQQNERKKNQQITKIKKELFDKINENKNLYQKVQRQEQASQALAVEAENVHRQQEGLKEKYLWLSKEKNKMNEELEVVKNELHRQPTQALIGTKQRSVTINCPHYQTKVCHLSDYPKIINQRIPTPKRLYQTSQFFKSPSRRNFM